MASSSGRKSGSSARSTSRKRVVIGAEETLRVRYRQDRPQVESERRQTRARDARRGDGSQAKAGKRLSNVKREERERRQRRLRIRRTLVVVLACAVVGSIAWGVIALSRSQVFALENVIVEGTRHHTPDSIQVLAGARLGEPLTYLSTKRIEKRLAEDPWIAEADVDRDFPHTLTIRVTEHVPAVVVDGGGDNLWIVSDKGVWLTKRSAEDTGLVLVRDVTTITPEAGVVASEPEVRNAVSVVAQLSDELLARLAMVSAPMVDETALITTDDVEIFVGQAVDMPEKNRIISEILKKEKGSVVYINVRVINRPTWRGL